MGHLMSLLALSWVVTVGPFALLKFPLLKHVTKSSLYTQSVVFCYSNPNRQTVHNVNMTYTSDVTLDHFKQCLSELC